MKFASLGMWEKCWEFSSGASGQVLLKFYLEPPRGGEWKIAKIIGVHWPRWLPCPYMINAFKTQHFQNWGCHIADSLHKSSGTGSIPKLLKWWSYIDIWPFYGEITFASVCIWMGSRYLYGKNVDILFFQLTSPLKPLGQCCSNFMWSFFWAEEKDC